MNLRVVEPSGLSTHRERVAAHSAVEAQTDGWRRLHRRSGAERQRSKTMSAAVATLPPPSTALQLLEVRVLPEFCAFWLTWPWLSSVAPRGDGHPILVLPGLLADDSSTSVLRGFLNARGYNAHGWNQGRNFGLRPNLERDMLVRIDELFERH